MATSDAVGHEFTPPFQLRVTYASGEAVQSIFYSTDHVGARAAQTQTPTSANTTSSPTAEPSTSPVATIASYAATGNGFSSCKFNFGAAYTQGQSFDGLDYVSVWIGSPSPQFGNNFNPFFHGTMLDACLESSVTPYFYAYIIAFMARSQENLQDCDVSGSKNLCTDGADFIRGNRQGILDVYANYATGKVLSGCGSLHILVSSPFILQRRQRRLAAAGRSSGTSSLIGTSIPTRNKMEAGYLPSS